MKIGWFDLNSLIKLTMNKNIQINISDCEYSSNLYLIDGEYINITINCHDDYEWLYELLGYIGGFSIVITYLFQLVKVYKTQSTVDLSIKFLIAAMTGTIFMLAYGIFINQMPLIVANVLIGIEVGLKMFGKIYFEKKCPCQKSDANVETQEIAGLVKEPEVIVAEVIEE